MINELLKKFPKKRPELDPRIKLIYEKEYLKNRGGENTVQSLAKKLEAWMHKKVAGRCGKRILELGAGTLNHLPYESDYEAYDIVEPFSRLYQNRQGLNDVNTVWGDVSEVEAPGYDKILSIAVLEHVEDLPQVLAKSCGLLNINGVFQAGIPSEGGLIWGLAWRLTTGFEFFCRTGLNYANLMRHEHVNNAREIELLCRWFFRDVKVKYFPIYGLHCSLYMYLECRIPHMDRAKEVLR
jgi:hypothetical protein